MLAPLVTPKELSHVFPMLSACPGPSSNPSGSKNPKVGNRLNPKTLKSMVSAPPRVNCSAATVPIKSPILVIPLNPSSRCLTFRGPSGLPVRPRLMKVMLKR